MRQSNSSSVTHAATHGGEIFAAEKSTSLIVPSSYWNVANALGDFPAELARAVDDEHWIGDEKDQGHI